MTHLKITDLNNHSILDGLNKGIHGSFFQETDIRCFLFCLSDQNAVIAPSFVFENPYSSILKYYFILYCKLLKSKAEF